MTGWHAISRELSQGGRVDVRVEAARLDAIPEAAKDVGVLKAGRSIEQGI